MRLPVDQYLVASQPHYYNKLNGGRPNRLTEAGRSIASKQRSQLIVPFTKAVGPKTNYVTCIIIN
jgi:hypothetical protein